MEIVIDMYPQTVGEELKRQIEYKKMQDKNFNSSELSRQIRDKLIQEFGFERKDDDENASTRPAMITELQSVGRKEKTPKFMYLFMAFKCLEIIKDDIVILQMLNDYEIIPKKGIDKDNLEKYQHKLGVNTNPVLNKTFYNGINICTKCKEKNIPCDNTQKCINIKIFEQLSKLSVNEQINYLYSLGLPSTFKNAKNFYTVSIQTLKSLLEKLNMLDLKNKIENIETQCTKNLNYDGISKEEQNSLKELIKRKKKHIKSLKELQPTLVNIKKEELQYKVEIEQRKLDNYKHKSEHLEKIKNVTSKRYESAMIKEIEILLYGKYY